LAKRSASQSDGVPAAISLNIILNVGHARKAPAASGASSRNVNALRTLARIHRARIIGMTMPPLTSPNRQLNPVLWRILLLLACMLVFSFALHAKLAVYGQTTGPHPSTSSKLWLNAEKLQPQSVAPAATVFFLAALLPGLFVPRTPTNHQTVAEAALVSQDRLFFQRRFLRPPPRA
jgi:hypothetical protein